MEVLQKPPQRKFRKIYCGVFGNYGHMKDMITTSNLAYLLSIFLSLEKWLIRQFVSLKSKYFNLKISLYYTDNFKIYQSTFDINIMITAVFNINLTYSPWKMLDFEKIQPNPYQWFQFFVQNKCFLKL